MSKTFEGILKEASVVKQKVEKPVNKFVKRAEEIIGGKADYMPPSMFDTAQLAMGVAVEMEHTDDFAKALEIAKDHLIELPDYYTRLKNMEEEGKAEFGIEDDSEEDDSEEDDSEED